MDQVPSSEIPTHPKLRAVNPQLVKHEGRSYIFLRDPLGLSEYTALIPQPLVSLLALCDGTRDVATLQAGLALRTGVRLAVPEIRDLVAQLDSALLLENGAYQRASQQALDEYRVLHHREPSCAGRVYPADADSLASELEAYCAEVQIDPPAQPSTTNLLGMVCPHIDYARGHETYARLWQAAAPALEDVELVIVFGTDHAGGPGALTLTRQDYATPFGVMPTETKIVDGLADVLGQDAAFAEEVHHINEHSIELALVWLHYFLGGQSRPVVPILCGSYQDFVGGEADPEMDESIDGVLGVLKEATAGRRTLVVAAADLAHVGPAFGDPLPLDGVARSRLSVEDSASLAAVCEGDAAAFFRRSQEESDARRICGLSPIYLALRYLEYAGGEHSGGEQARGELTGYAHCPADEQGSSLVSIAGVLLYEPS